MAQRVALYGGRLQAGQDPGGGFVVAAEVPTVEVMR
jgi:signal transduction histidine kinase